MKVVIIANSPAPYRDPIYEELSRKDDVDLTVIYCSLREKNRKWNLEKVKHKTIFLNCKSVFYIENSFYISPGGILKELRSINPDVVITSAFALPMIFAFLYTVLLRKRHIYFTDSTLVTEKKLTVFHKLARKLVFLKTNTFIGPSNATQALYRSYGIDDSKIFKSHLCVDNERFLNSIFIKDRVYDILFVGQMIDTKCPYFFIEVVRGLVAKLGVCNVRIVGSGPLQESMTTLLKATNANVTFDGFIQQEHLPSIYQSAKLLLMPTKADCWGVVANEALASGTPVITNIEAGVAGELVVDGISGRVLELETTIWVQEISKLLSDHNCLQKMSVKSLSMVSDYTYSNASQGLYHAIKST
jgi:glycosyltransferase involved in cell wall biosynthesis